MRRVHAFVAVMLLALILAQAIPAGGATRADERLGWQAETFQDNVNLTFSPKTPTPMEPVVIRAESRNPQVPIQVAYAYMTIQIPNSGPVTTGLTFSRFNDTVMTCTLSAYPNGTLVRFYVNILDFYNTPAISGNYTYTVAGQDRPGGWVRSQFDKNLNITWVPYLPNATEPSKVTIRSKDGVAIYGAYLYLTYEIKIGQPQSGGYPFVRINQTAMSCEIPGYPMGTGVRFWVSAWDKYNNLTISGYYNYTVPREEDYTSHEFVPMDGLSIVGGLAAFAAVGSVAYLRVLNQERKRREKGTKYGKTGFGKEGTESTKAEETQRKQGAPAKVPVAAKPPTPLKSTSQAKKEGPK